MHYISHQKHHGLKTYKNMREYTNLTNIYPSTIKFGNYAIYQLLSPNYVDSRVLNFYNYSSNLEKEQTVIFFFNHH